MARLCGLQTDNLDSWRQSRILVVRHDDHGQLLRMISVDPGVALSAPSWLLKIRRISSSLNLARVIRPSFEGWTPTPRG
jgi:hypothetical protein